MCPLDERCTSDCIEAIIAPWRGETPVPPKPHVQNAEQELYGDAQRNAHAPVDVGQVLELAYQVFHVLRT